MFTITEKAAEKAIEFLTAEGKAGWGLRIYQAGESCCGPSFGLDLEENPAADDQVFETGGLRVFINRDCTESLSEMTLEYVVEDDKEGFILSGGKAPSCGAAGSDCSSCG